MKAYCINLDRRPERLSHMLEECENAGFSFERIAAVDGADPAVVAESQASGAHSGGRPLSPGVYACFQSHRKAWKVLIESGERHALVLEDDMLLAPDFGRYLEESWIPRDADIVRLETFGIRVHVDSGAGLAAGPRRLHVLRSYHHGAGAYVVSAEAAKELYRLTEKISGAVDQVMFDIDSPIHVVHRIYQMIPSPAVQGNRISNSKTDWSETSLHQRFNDLSGPNTRETFLQRVFRRGQEELRGIANGTRYRMVQFG